MEELKPQVYRLEKSGRCVLIKTVIVMVLEKYESCMIIFVKQGRQGERGERGAAGPQGLQVSDITGLLFLML